MANLAPGRDAPIVLLGSRSRAGAALKRAFSDRTIIGICREPGGGELAVADYDRVPEGAIPSGAVLINCLGRSEGDAATLHRVNVELPLRWAEAARAADGRVLHLSSFSVYGAASLIGAATPERPAGAYGESKLAGDRALLSLADDRFRVTVLRLPILIGEGDDKLVRLIRLLRRTGFLPVPAGPVHRSMLAYADLGTVVGKALDGDGILHAADPEPFSYALLGETMAGAGLKLRTPTAPAWLIGAARTLAPGIGRRLYASSLLDPAANLARGLPLPVGLRRVLAAMLAAEGMR
ncbi:MAG TPA: NAD-dependent epimerase/dehydratase family protein [Allosphingosinicella sp.]|nr:NAD-dependent epimerase/dehydratase family protein [Allosphingosinicella sp.]